MYPLVLAAGFTDVRPGLIFWTLITFFIVLFALKRVATLVQRAVKNGLDRGGGLSLPPMCCAPITAGPSATSWRPAGRTR